jgi:hypothetical protein
MKHTVQKKDTSSQLLIKYEIMVQEVRWTGRGCMIWQQFDENKYWDVTVIKTCDFICKEKGTYNNIR